jgi:hypothetical protein
MKRKILLFTLMIALSAINSLNAQTDTAFTHNATRNVTYQRYPGDKVGIGTATPSNKLEIKDAFVASGLYENPTVSWLTTNGSSSWYCGNITGYIAAGSGNSTSGYPGGLLFKTKAADGNTATQPTTKMCIDAAGNVGIGTTAPYAKLEILKNSSSYTTETEGGISILSQFSESKLILGAYAGNWSYIQSLQNGTSWTTRPLVLQPNGGDVGIGTSPSAKLDVNGSVMSNNSFVLKGDGSNTITASPYLYFTNTAGNQASAFELDANNAITLWQYNSSSAWQRNITFLKDGYIGIGISVPIFQTEIYGFNQYTAALTDAGARGGILALNMNDGNAGSGGAIVFGNSQSHNSNSIGFAAIKGLLVSGATNTTGDLAFSTRNSTTDNSLTERMRILSTGNVGIGTSAPAAKLDIKTASYSNPAIIVEDQDSINFIVRGNGHLIARDIIVNTNVITPDYVFNKDYNLISINEVENYISKNGHLPDVPSANEIKNSGLNVAEMDATLLKKIEELTLYVIELKKQNEAQQTEIELLKKN